MNKGNLLNQYLKKESQSLGPLARKLAKIKHWHKILKENLPYSSHDILKHCYVIHHDKTSLTILVDSPHWAHKLRFLSPQLLAKLKQQPNLSSLSNIRHKIAIINTVPHKKVQVKAREIDRVSQKNMDIIRKTANQITDQKLQNILNKLATTLER